MTFILHYNGRYEDSIVIKGDTIEEIRDKAKKEAESRLWKEDDCWSEEVKEGC